ncbi:glycosyltransferase family 2 protein [Reichenbachiella ulvae]|uniref:Glycosyltransferase n=1 Tax=Reichenbachiella ulvae TaxID=2980104 RepID=A0ABT3CQJ9_9BACT|nr:glycosyltransferase family 2 protein [Reichenbachiella ulvae]MCV9385823.1 glycosyltransferase [Reichenbachiella ulvae]
MKPQVSVILPFRNAASTLPEAVDSIISQSHSPVELILINNKSTDSSLQIAQNYCNQHKHIRLLHEDQIGVSHAANRGMNAAKGEYLARMDADDISYPERLESQVQELIRHKADICATQADVVIKNNKGFHHFVEWSNSILSTEDIYGNRFVEFPLINPTLMITKSCWEQVGPFYDEDYPEDYEWFLRALYKKMKIIKLGKAHLFWRDSETRLTRSSEKYSTDAFFKIKTHYLSKELKDRQQASVWIWGAGKLARQRVEYLKSYQVKVEGFIDIKNTKQHSNYRCIHYESIRKEEQPFILSYVTNRNKRDEIKNFLLTKGYIEDRDFLLMG